MPSDNDAADREPTRAEVEAMAGPVVVEFGAGWCPYCQALQPYLAAALQSHPDVRHVKVEDGKGKPLGRSFGVKLWPTLVFLRDGREVQKSVRPDPTEVLSGFEALAAAGG
jgi:thioredoxin 1